MQRAYVPILREGTGRSYVLTREWRGRRCRPVTDTSPGRAVVRAKRNFGARPRRVRWPSDDSALSRFGVVDRAFGEGLGNPRCPDHSAVGISLYVPEDPAGRIALEDHERAHTIWAECIGGHWHQDGPCGLARCRGDELGAFPVHVVHVVGSDLVTTNECLERRRVQGDGRNRGDQPCLRVPLQPPLTTTPHENLEGTGPERNLEPANLTPIRPTVLHDRDITDALRAHAVDLKSRDRHLGSGSGRKERSLGHLGAVRADNPYKVVSEL